MKKLILILLCFNAILISAQSKYTLEEVEKSNDPKVVANFIVNNPNHPKITDLKQKLAQLMMVDTENKTTATPPKAENYTPKKEIKKSVTPENQQTEEILNHILNSSERSEEAYVAVKNLSRCPIVVHFDGKKKYALSVESNTIGRILIEKGNYNISSKVCSANYQNQRTISKDWELTLNTSR